MNLPAIMVSHETHPCSLTLAQTLPGIKVLSPVDQFLLMTSEFLRFSICFLTLAVVSLFWKSSGDNSFWAAVLTSCASLVRGIRYRPRDVGADSDGGPCAHPPIAALTPPHEV